MELSDGNLLTPTVRYEPHVVTFIDILGFTALVAADIVGSTIANQLRTAHKRASLSAARHNASLVNFSDTIVRFAPLGPADRKDVLREEIRVVARMQALLADDRIPIRGGMTIGPLHYESSPHGGTHLFGPGLIAAYRLESRLAHYPRIVMDPALAKDIDGLDAPLRQDADAVVFVDYLGALGAECSEDIDYAELLRRHRAWTHAALRKWREKPALRAKYGWLGRYHNLVVSDINAQWLKALSIRRKALVVSTRTAPDATGRQGRRRQ